MGLKNIFDPQCCLNIFTPQPLRAVGVLFLPTVSGWAGGRKKFVQAVSQKPEGVGAGESKISVDHNVLMQFSDPVV